MFIIWDDTMTVGHEMIDRDHEHFVEIINTLHEAILRRQGQDVIGATLCDLADYARYHFEREERLMQQRQYRGYKEHRRLHEALVIQLGELIYRFERGDSAVTLETLEFLRNWLLNHVKGTDQEFAAFLARTA